MEIKLAGNAKDTYKTQGFVDGQIELSLGEWLEYKNNLTSLGSGILEFLQKSGFEIPMEKPEGLEKIVMEFWEEKGPEILPGSVLWDQKSNSRAIICGKITYNGTAVSEILITMSPTVYNGVPSKEQCGPHKNYVEINEHAAWQIALRGMFGSLRVTDMKKTMWRNWRAQP